MLKNSNKNVTYIAGVFFIIIVAFVFSGNDCPNDRSYSFENNNYSHLMNLVHNVGKIRNEFPYNFDLDANSFFYGNGIMVYVSGNTFTLKDYFYNSPQRLSFRLNYWYFKSKSYKPFSTKNEFLTYFHLYFKKLDELGILRIVKSPNFLEIYTGIHDSTYTQIRINNSQYKDENYDLYNERNKHYKCVKRKELNYYYVIFSCKDDKVIKEKRKKVNLYKINDSCYIYRSAKYSIYDKIGTITTN